MQNPNPEQLSKSIPRPFSPHSTQQISTSSQTESTMPVEEEHISFPADFQLDENFDLLKQNYAEAVSFINSYHQRLNTEIENNHSDETELFLLPMVENFIPLFSYLTGRESEETIFLETNKRKAIGTFAIRRTTEMPPDPTPVGDCKNVQTYDEAAYSRDFTIIKEQLENLISICLMSRNINSITSNERLEVSPNSSDESTDESECEDTEDSSSICSDEEDMNNVLEPVCCSGSETSTLSESSDIKSDTIGK